MLLKLPPELRVQVFQSFFRSLIIKHGFDIPRSTYNTSILLACRMFHTEASPLLLPNITLHFRNTETLVDSFTKFTPEQIRALRFLRVKAFPFPIYATPNANYYKTHNLSAVLTLFPGLQLDQLIVEDCFHDPGVNDGWGDGGTFVELRSLLRLDGWRELHFFSPNAEFIIYSLRSHDHTKATNVEELLSDWKKELTNRDGEESGSEVRLFVTKEEHQDIEKEEDRTELVSKEELQSIELDHSTLVSAKRGRNCDIVLKKKVYQEKEWLFDIHELFSKMTWEEIKEAELVLEAEVDPCRHL
ncbi:hypothetical protein BT69DRAFT_1288211 [Atractiella rhizophila]|nr:hypothetical protein BT69DRAFT_1288211 [Atractiella rhizophila]